MNPAPRAVSLLTDISYVMSPARVCARGWGFAIMGRMSSPPLPSASTLLAMLVALALSAAVAGYLLRRRPRDWAPIAAIALLCFGFALAYDQFLPDDSYITYRYALNLLHGQGLVFNPGEYVQSTTTPLYTLLLAAAGLIWPDLPVTSHILSLPALFAGALLLYLLLAEHGKMTAGLLLAALYILNPFTAAVYSSESILHVALIFAALYAYDHDRLGWTAAAAAGAVLTRGDGALVAIALGAHWLLTRRTDWRRLIVPAAVYVAISAPWYLFAWAYYGSPAPATMSAKIAQGALPNAPLYGPGLGFWWMAYAQHSLLYWLIPPLALLGLLLTLPRGGDRWAWPMLIWVALYTGGYTLLQVTRYQNYYTPIAPALLLLAMLGAHWLGVALTHATPAWRAAGAGRGAALTATALGVAIGAGFWATGSNLFPSLPQARAVIYQQIGEWLRAATPAGASVGMYEVGTVGYYAQRRIIDFYGLIQPEVAQHLADPTWAPQHYQPDYIVIHPDWYYAALGPWFAQQYRPVKTFTYDRCTCSPMVLYARK
jgi:hypothetical protein